MLAISTVMKPVLSSLVFMLRSCFQTRASMHIEILALRHQLAVVQRRTNKRPSLRNADRLLWVMLSRSWAQWRSALVIVKPETVIAWQREGYCQLNSRRNEGRDSGKESRFVISSINHCLDASRLFPQTESRFHYCSVSASAVQMSRRSEV